MAYGTIKVDNITFTSNETDETITVSGIVQSISGNLTVTGTIQGANIIGTSTVSGATVTGDIGTFTTITGGVATLTSGVFASGVAATPSISIGTVSNGFYSPAENQVALSTSGTGRLFVDASGNVGVGTQTPSNYNSGARNFVIQGGSNTGLTIGTTSLTGNSRIYFADSTGGSGDRAGQINYEHANDSMWFATGGEERLRITSTGLVGIGTLTPGAQLHTAGGIMSTSTIPGYTATSAFFDRVASYARFASVGPDASNAGPIRFSQYSSNGSISRDAMSIDGAGRVGIGTASVDELLHVESDGATPKIKVESTLADSSPGFRVTNDARSYDIRIDGTNDNLQFYDATASQGRVAIDSSGRLLVGTSSAVADASSLLQISSAGGPKLALNLQDGTVASGQFVASIDFYSFGGFVNESIASIQASADGAHASGDKPGRLVFSTTADGASSPTERMRISSNGSYQHFTDAGYGIRSAYAASASDTAIFLANSATNIVNGTICLRIYSNGDVKNTNGVFTSLTSDERFKQDITELGPQWDDIKGIKLKKFRYKNDPTGELQLGVIAQELQQVCPGLVTTRTATEEDVDASGGLVAEGDEVLGWKMSILPLKAVKALQEAMERIETLEAKVAALETK